LAKRTASRGRLAEAHGEVWRYAGVHRDRRRRATGAFLYDAAKNALTFVAPTDVRRVTSYQDFVDEPPLDLADVADHTRMRMVPAGRPAHLW
jgi:hypothetical protein